MHWFRLRWLISVSNFGPTAPQPVAGPPRLFSYVFQKKYVLIHQFSPEYFMKNSPWMVTFTPCSSLPAQAKEPPSPHLPNILDWACLRCLLSYSESHIVSDGDYSWICAAEHTKPRSTHVGSWGNFSNPSSPLAFVKTKKQHVKEAGFPPKNPQPTYAHLILRIGACLKADRFLRGDAHGPSTCLEGWWVVLGVPVQYTLLFPCRPHVPGCEEKKSSQVNPKARPTVGAQQSQVGLLAAVWVCVCVCTQVHVCTHMVLAGLGYTPVLAILHTVIYSFNSLMSRFRKHEA